MIVDRFYYNQLNSNEKEIYKVFYEGIKEYKELIPLSSKTKITEEMMHRIFCAITDDNPLIYYINQSVLSMAQDQFGNIAICPKYFFSAKKIKEYDKKIQDAVNKLVMELRLTEGTEVEKVKTVHDYICRNITYDFKGADKRNPVKVIVSHNIVGVFAHHSAQCEGIAKAVKILLNTVDVKCIVVSGRATTDKGRTSEHAWNMVNLGGKPYHLDVTWDIGASLNGEISYDYFNVTNAQILCDHKIKGKVPKCVSEEKNYFRMMNLIFSNKKAIKVYIDSGLKNGQRMFYFRVAGKLRPESIIKEIADYGARVLLIKGKQVKCSHVINSKMRTCRITYY